MSAVRRAVLGRPPGHVPPTSLTMVMSSASTLTFWSTGRRGVWVAAERAAPSNRKRSGLTSAWSRSMSVAALRDLAGLAGRGMM